MKDMVSEFVVMVGAARGKRRIPFTLGGASRRLRDGGSEPSVSDYQPGNAPEDPAVGKHLQTVEKTTFRGRAPGRQSRPDGVLPEETHGVTEF